MENIGLAQWALSKLPEDTQLAPPIQPYPEKSAEGFVNLNLSPTYASNVEGFDAFRELVQNWIDQARALAGDAKLICKREEEETQSGNICAHYLVVESASGAYVCVGYIAERALPDRRIVDITNFNSAISQDALILGHSEKASGLPAAGCYGEGMKVEINRMISSKKAVSCYTNGQRWTFGYINNAGGKVNTLQVLIENGQWAYWSHLTFEITCPPPESDDWLITSNQFLFLEPTGLPDNTIFASNGETVEVLISPHTKGKIFAKGIFVKNEPELHNFGLNFIGGASTHASFGFGRDRNTIYTRALVTNLPSVITKQRREGNSKLADAILVEIYKELETEKNTVLQSLVGTAKDISSISDGLVSVFNAFTISLECQRPIPTKIGWSDSSEEGQMFTFLGLTPIPVSSNLFSVLERSSSFPTLEKRWKELEADILQCPEWQPSSEEDVAIMDTLIHSALDWYGSEIERRDLLFKVFPDGNVSSAVVPLKQGNQCFYAIDTTLLQKTEETHIWLSKRGEGCLSGTSGLCNNACLLRRFTDELLLAIERNKPGIKRKLERKRINSLLASRMDKMPSHAVPHAAIETEAQRRRQNKEGQMRRQGGEAQPGVRGEEQPSIFDSPNTSMGESTYNTSQDSVPEPAFTPRKRMADELKVKTNSIRSEPPPTVDGRIRSDSPSGAEISAPECNGSRHYLQRAEDSKEHGMSIYLPADKSTQELKCRYTNSRRNAALALCSCISFLMSKVFDFDIQPPSSSISVFWEEANVVAFNSGGSLFFNAFHMDTSKSDLTIGVAHFWYVTICHELAHNKHPGHGLPHEQAEELLLREHAIKFFSATRHLQV